MIAEGPVRAAARLTGGVARHAAWWLRYRLNGHTRPTPQDPPRRQPQQPRRSDQ